MRSDAAGNRERILESARRILTTSSDVKLNAVAKAAGVGQGTLYRHFPTRDALLNEVYRADAEGLAESARALLLTDDAESALRAWVKHVAEYARVKQGVLAALSPTSGQQLASQHGGTIDQAVDLFLEAGKREGTIRSDVDAREVVTLLGFLSRVDPAEPVERVHHILDLIVDGLRATA
jgi:AcrR family transcriptional regulator